MSTIELLALGYLVVGLVLAAQLYAYLNEDWSVHDAECESAEAREERDLLDLFRLARQEPAQRARLAVVVALLLLAVVTAWPAVYGVAAAQAARRGGAS